MSAKYRTVIHANGVEFITNYPAGHGAARDGLDVELRSRRFRQCWESASVERWDDSEGDGGWTTLSYRVSDYEPDDLTNKGPRYKLSKLVFAALAVLALLVADIIMVALWALKQ